uniref:Uncharacterized protein n=1 Tax=Anopheles atroparvus TaxID=41427 RepID=A0A182IQ18_ANOAO
LALVRGSCYPSKAFLQCFRMDALKEAGGLKRYAVNTEKSGEIIVTVQGDLSQQEKRAVFLTVHDLGTNHSSFEEFVNSACMIEIKERSCFIHIDVPGHADNAPNLADA